MIDASSYEKMDLFYLGEELDPENGNATGLPLLYKSKHLTTHAVIIGMTGSGKTGLGIGLLEEAAMDGIPALVIDPKGDMGNLLLTFPDLLPDDFLPWVDPIRAEQRGISLEELARQEAETWRQGLAAWGQDGERIRRLREKADFAIYTPGSSSGRPVSVLDSFRAPRQELLDDDETLAALVNSAVSSLLGLLGIEADPLQSREHILLSSLVLHQWRLGQDLDLESLIGLVISPPFDKVGVFPLNTIFPQPKRMELAMRLNNILASPAFQSWTTGQSLDIDHFLYTAEGTPRISIFSIAHLGDRERMFFVSLLLGRLIGWMRRQEGSSSLRALLYMDEIFGYFPPTANPPSKKPMLMLLKQARAFGIGVVLATQNPVDLDYKGLANIGTWFVGRLQTRQDQDRVMGGLAGSSSRLETDTIRTLLARMRGRSFLLHTAHRQETVLFESRWVMSYLRGPIQLSEIERLEQHADEIDTQHSPPPLLQSQTAPDGFSSTPPLLADTLPQCFLPPPLPLEEVRLTAWIGAAADVRYYNQRRGIDKVEHVCLHIPAAAGVTSIPWDEADTCPVDLDSVRQTPPAGSLFGPVPAELTDMKNFLSQKKAFADYLYHSKKLQLLRCRRLRIESRPGETEEEFHQRVASLLREKKEEKAALLEERYRKKEEILQNRLERALARVEKEKADVRSKGIDTALSFGVAVFGALFGRKPFSVTTASRSARGIRSAGRMLREKNDVVRAKQEVERLEADLAELAAELQDKLAELSDRFSPEQYPIEPFAIKPRRSDIFNLQVCLLWEPDLHFLEDDDLQQS